MPAPLAVRLSPAQEAELVALRDRHPTPYVRERAAAVLQVAGGRSARAVARAGLLRPRRRETVARWVARYLAEGPVGLAIRPGRGRRPAVFPPAR
jgi:transposase